MQILDQGVEVSGGRVFVRQWQPPNPAQPPIVLLHDSLGSVELWRGFPLDLAQATGRSVLAYDRLGFGQSSPRNSLPSLDFIREEAEQHFLELQQTLGLRRYALLGHSVGGGMALSIAAAHPQACEAVVSISAQAFVEERTLEGIRLAKAKFAEAGQMDKLAKWHGPKARWVLEAWTEVWLCEAYRGWNLESTLSKVRCPVLVIHGDQDEYGSVAFPQAIAAGVGGASEQLVLPGCGHMPHREQPQALLQRIAAFLA